MFVSALVSHSQTVLRTVRRHVGKVPLLIPQAAAASCVPATRVPRRRGPLEKGELRKSAMNVIIYLNS